VNARLIRAGDSIGAARGEFVVCVAAGGRLEDFADSVRSVLAHTPDSVPVLLHGAAAAAAAPVLEAVASPRDSAGADRVRYLDVAAPGTGVAEAVAAAAPADVVLVSAGCVVAPGWSERLSAAAGAAAEIATVSALRADRVAEAESGSGEIELEAAATRVAQASLRIRPRLSRPAPPCVYVRRSAVELAGSPAAPRFAAACVGLGLSHILADDVVVRDPGGGGPGPDPVTAGHSGPLARAISVARRAVGQLSVVIDARILNGPLDGTRVHVLELIGAVAATGSARVTALVSPGLDRETAGRLARLPGVTLSTVEGADPSLHGDVVHRPYQVSAPADLTVLAGFGDRLVVTHQDLISFHNPEYFPSSEGWAGYRDLTRRALGAADRVLFFSEHVRADALTEELVEPSRAEVVHLGVDHTIVAAPAAPSRPPGLDAVPADAEVMLCLGSDFLHKNRIFALRVLAELKRRHGWEGRLVLAGPAVTYGSSRARERALLAQEPSVAAAVLELGSVSEAEKEWLLERAGLVLYPTVHEGFGLIPYEAAAKDVPCLWAPGTALSELLGDAAAGIVAWDPAASADHAFELMRQAPAREANVGAVRQAGSALRWQVTGRRLIDVYRAVCDDPPAPASALEREGGLMSAGVSEDAMRLVGPDGVLARDLERPLLALLSRRRLAAPVSAAMKAGYRVSQRRRRDGGER